MSRNSFKMECFMRPLSLVSNSSKPLFTLYFAIALIAGCGGPGQVNVSGKITVDGAPAVGAVLLFHPIDAEDVSIASGVSGSGGSFTLTTSMKPGIPPGKYAVTVTWPDPSFSVKTKEPAKIQMKEDSVTAPDLLRGRYIMKDKSRLSAEINSSTKELPPFQLKSK